MPLSGEDKRWISAQLGEVKSNCASKPKLLRRAWPNRSKAFDICLLQQIEGVETRLLEQIEGVETCTREHTEAVETRLLGEFWKWARTADARYRQSHSVVGALDERVPAVEDRVADLERRRAS